MATSIFSTRDDDLRFRRITWLLSLLETKAESDTSSGYPDPVAKPLLEQVAWLANLLVRNHEVVAVMPHRNGQCLYVVEPQPTGVTEGSRNLPRRVPAFG